ncbi:MAG: DUF3885 domain-containing protein [Clostridia bacterium]|nr:DUF3885 domain-containing protein [Clostridia bacterium]
MNQVQHYDLNGGPMSLPFVPHDFVIKRLDVTLECVTFTFEDDVTYHDGIRELFPGQRSLILRFHLCDDMFFAYRWHRGAVKGQPGCFRPFDAEKLPGLCAGRLEYIDHHVSYRSAVIELAAPAEPVILKLSADYMEYEWIGCEDAQPDGTSRVEALIRSRDFPYLQPYFYNHPYALRCELGIGDDGGTFRKTARERAAAIFDILFPGESVDAVFFHDYIMDYAGSGDADGETNESIRRLVDGEAERLRFLAAYQSRYRHVTVRDLPHPDTVEEVVRKNRVICYADGKTFDCQHLLERQLTDWCAPELHFVSFANECILSVYDDRGCDVVFATYEKMAGFYPLLKPLFLAYDAEEMERRLHRTAEV